MAERAFDAVTFDVGGTLIEPWPSVGHVYAGVAKEFGQFFSPDEINTGFARAWKARGAFDYSRAAWFSLVRAALGPEADKLPEEFFPKVYQRFVAADAWRIFDDVLPVLKQLGDAGLMLAVISNWDERLHPMLDELRLRRHFQLVLCSHDVASTKPQPRIFDVAAERLGVPRARMLHVGDSENEDVTGARNAGMAAVLIDRKRRERRAPDRLGTLFELLTMTGVRRD